MNRLAKNLVKKYGTANPFEIANELDIEVIIKNLPGNIKGIFVEVLEQSAIIVNKRESEKVQKTIIAKEIAHAIKHHEELKEIHVETDHQDKNKKELEANEFAAQLLCLYRKKHNQEITIEEARNIINKHLEVN